MKDRNSGSKSLTIAVFALGILVSLSSAEVRPSTKVTPSQSKKSVTNMEQFLGPIRTFVNHPPAPMRITLSDGVSTILLPAGWSHTYRGAYWTDRSIGMFYDFLRPPHSTGGLHISMLYKTKGGMQIFDATLHQHLDDDLASGRNERLLEKMRLHMHLATLEETRQLLRNNHYEDASWGGLKGEILTHKDGSLIYDFQETYLGFKQPYRYALGVASDTKMYSVKNSIPGSPKIVRLVLESFQAK